MGEGKIGDGDGVERERRGKKKKKKAEGSLSLATFTKAVLCKGYRRERRRVG